MQIPHLKQGVGPAAVALVAVIGATGIVIGAGHVRASDATVTTGSDTAVVLTTTSHPLTPAVERAVANTVEVVANGTCKTEIGSAWSFAAGYFATNAHVVAGSSSVQIWTPSGTATTATIVLFDPALDVAVLKTDPASARPFTLAASPPSAHEKAYTIGYPSGGEAVKTATVDGEAARQVSAFGSSGTGSELMDLFQGSTTFGNSGGPLIDASGQVIGMVTGIYSDRTTGIVLDDAAIDISQIEPDLIAAHTLTAQVSAGTCSG